MKPTAQRNTGRTPPGRSTRVSGVAEVRHWLNQVELCQLSS